MVTRRVATDAGRGPRRQRGQAATEVVVVSVSLAAALLLPWLEGESPAALLLGTLLALARAFETWLYLL
jgi:hypothetical protein